MSPTSRLNFLLLLMAFAAFSASAQVQTGTPPFGSFGGGPDVINLANLNSHLSIPVLHKPGRGTNFTYDLSYESSVWYRVTSGSTTSWQPVWNWGWVGQTQVTSGYVDYSVVHGGCNLGTRTDPYVVAWDRYTFRNFHDQFGRIHVIGTTVSNNGGQCPNDNSPDGVTVTLNDGSGFTVFVSSGPTVIVYPSVGGSFNPPLQTGNGPGTVTDRNGNQITTNGSTFTDTLGTTALTVAGAGTPLSPNTFTYTTPNGTNASYTMHYTAQNILTNFGCSGVVDYAANGVNLVSDITLPDNSTYTFTYEPTPGVSGYVTGRVKTITLPTGGTITYTYSGGGTGVNGITCADGSAATVTRATPDGTWTYARTQVNGTQWQTIVTDPTAAANQTAIQFQGIYEAQRQVYQGSASGTPLQTANTCYNAAISPCTGTPIILPITQRTVIATVPGSGGLQSQHTDKFDLYGNVTESDDYDFATAAPFPLLRQTLISYAPLGNNLNAFTQTVTVKDGSGVIKSRQDTNYDEYTSFTGANCIADAPQHDNIGKGCSFTARGNATSVTSYTDPITPGGAITKNFTYDSLGNLRTAQLNCCQQKTWAYSITNKYAYPDSVTSGSSAPQLTTSFTYDLNMGLTLTSTDPNNVQTTFTYDNMGRPLTAKVGSNPATNYTYNDYNNSSSFTPWTVQVCSPVQGANTACQKTILDSQGRAGTTQLLDGVGTLYSASDAQYDAFGRAYRASNPYTSSAAYWTQTYFDTLGRPVRTTLPDNSASTISYTDNTTTTTDPAGKQRKVVSDGLGRMTSVWEPDPASGNTLTLQTSYAYNVLGELTQVTQGVQTRTYVYDALGRLSSSTTPEAGMVCFGTLSGSTCQPNGYDSFNNLLYRTDARGVVTNYQYDLLNRLIGVGYTVPTGIGVAAMPNVCTPSGGTAANVCFAYGTTAASFNNGLLISMTDPSGSESYTYDQFGNVTQLAKVIGTSTYTTSYLYNLANRLTQITYPSGRAVNQNVDTIGRLSSIIGTLNSVNTTYASGFGYNSAQQVTGFNYGNNINAAFGYSADRLQSTCLDYSTTNRNGTCAHDLTTKFGLTYSYGAAGSNNGQIGGITDNMDNGRNATYTYDSLYRLSTAATAGSATYPAWGLSMAYDRYGNRLNQTQTAGNPPTNSLSFASPSGGALTNRPDGMCFDANGNLTAESGTCPPAAPTYAYDAENRLVNYMGSSAAYTYDGNGLRVKKAAGGATTVYIFSGSKVTAEYDNGAVPASPSREYIYAGGALLAKIEAGAAMYYHHDHLSNRLLTDPSGNVLGQRGHFPFGETWYESGTTTKLKFTTYERDSESSNDYALARGYINRFGRFPSTDPVRGSSGNPQTLNSYAYVLNNTLNLVAPGIAGATLAPSLNRAAYISLGSAAAPRLGSTASSESPTSRERLHVELGSDGGVNDPYKRGIPAGTISALFKIPGAAPVIITVSVDPMTGQQITTVDTKKYLDDPQVRAFMKQYSLPGMINEVSLGEALYLYEYQLKGSLADFGNDALGGPVWGPLGSWFSPGDVSNFGGSFRDGLPIHIPEFGGGGLGGGLGGMPSWCNAFCRL